MTAFDIPELRRLWEHASRIRDGATDALAPNEWMRFVVLIRGLELGLRETLSFVYDGRPSYEGFVQWAVDHNGGSIDPARLERIAAAMRGEAPAAPSADPVFTADEMAFWHEHGYVVLHDAVPPEQCAAAEKAIWTFLEMSRDDPDTWYGNPHGHSIWVPLLHHPALQANRAAPRIRRAFAQLWGRDDLWVTTDQTGFNPPERANWQFPGPHLHWDTNLTPPIPFNVQGVLYLVDVAPEQGAFTCVPGFHRRIDAWLRALPDGADPRAQALDALGAVHVAGRAGDLIIWHQALPHGSSPNRAQRPRIVQYVSMNPSSWEESTAPWR